MDFLKGEHIGIGVAVKRLLDFAIDSRAKNRAEFQEDEENNLNVDMELQKLKLKRMKMSEEKLLGQISEIQFLIKLEKDVREVEVSKMVKTTENAKREIEKNTNLKKKFKEETRAFKEGAKIFNFMTKKIVTEIAYPKHILENFLKVSPEGRCTDEEFC